MTSVNELEAIEAEYEILLDSSYEWTDDIKGDHMKKLGVRNCLIKMSDRFNKVK